MSDSEQYIFYSSKRHVIHMGINIAIAPFLLYLIQIWAWPPVLPHYIVFAITTMLAFRYMRKNMQTPRLMIDDAGVHADQLYPAESIYKAVPAYRSITLSYLLEDRIKTRTFGLGWASRADCETIQQLLTDRFQREIPDNL